MPPARRRGQRRLAALVRDETADEVFSIRRRRKTDLAQHLAEFPYGVLGPIERGKGRENIGGDIIDSRGQHAKEDNGRLVFALAARFGLARENST
jgi:hypothetical protein